MKKLTKWLGSSVIGLWVYTKWIRKQSFESWMLEQSIRQENPKVTFSEEKFIQDLEEAQAISDAPFPNPEEFLKQSVREEWPNGVQTFIWNERDMSEQPVILYIHGGGYRDQPNGLHFETVTAIAKGIRAKVVCPIYPKVPRHTYRAAHEAIDYWYRRLLDEGVSPERLIVLGDSAGGGLALAYLQTARDAYLPQPAAMVLISPWVDVTMKTCEISAYESKDPLLEREELRRLGALWAGDLLVTDHRISPKFGDMKDLAPIYLSVGTRELFYPDIRTFHERLIAEGVVHHYVEKNNMVHEYVFFPIPEAEEAKVEIIQYLKSLLN